MLIAVLRGAVVFMGDLMRKIELPTNIDFMAVSSYGDGVKSSGIVRIIKDPDIDIRGRDVLIVEDILDSGLTLKYLMKNLGAASPLLWRSPPSCGRTLRTASRPSRPSMLEPIAPMPLWWATASTMPERYRNLPYLGILKTGGLFVRCPTTVTITIPRLPGGA